MKMELWSQQLQPNYLNFFTFEVIAPVAAYISLNVDRDTTARVVSLLTVAEGSDMIVWRSVVEGGEVEMLAMLAEFALGDADSKRKRVGFFHFLKRLDDLALEFAVDAIGVA